MKTYIIYGEHGRSGKEEIEEVFIDSKEIDELVTNYKVAYGVGWNITYKEIRASVEN